MCVCVCVHVCVCHVCVHRRVHSCTCTLCVRNKNQCHCKWYKPSLCECVVCVCVHRYVHSCTCTICENSVRNKNPKSQQVVQAQSVCACVCVGGVQAIYITMQGVLLHMYVLCE